MKTDIHCHFIPEALIKMMEADPAFELALESRSEDEIVYQIRGRRFVLNNIFFDVDEQIRRMADLGVDHTILSVATPLIDYSLDAEKAREQCTVFNNEISKLVENHPSKFSAWAFLPLQDPGFSAMELRRCVQELGFVGGHIGSNVCGKYLFSLELDPLWEEACKLGVPLFVHPANPVGARETNHFELTVVAGYLFDNTINILSLICSGMLDKWPDLKLIFAHSGAFSIQLSDRMQREVDTNPELSATLKRPVSEYLERLYFDTVCFDGDLLQYFVKKVSTGNMFLGSDGPFPLGEPDPVGFVTRSLPASQAAEIFSNSIPGLLKQQA